MTEFTFFLMVIFLPGIVAYKITDAYTVHKEHKTHEVIISSFLYGFISYLLYYTVFYVIAFCKSEKFTLQLFNTLKAQQLAKTTGTLDAPVIDFYEIFWVTGFGVIVGVVITLLDTYKILHRVAKFFCLIYKHGDLDTFTYLMRSSLIKNDAWVIIRDIEDDRAYAGWVAEYSIGKEQNELFLRDVVIFQNSTGELMMTSPGIYLAKPKEKYVIEFPDLKFTDKMDVEIIRKANEKWHIPTQEKQL